MKGLADSIKERVIKELPVENSKEDIESFLDDVEIETSDNSQLPHYRIHDKTIFPLSREFDSKGTVKSLFEISGFGNTKVIIDYFAHHSDAPIRFTRVLKAVVLFMEWLILDEYNNRVKILNQTNFSTTDKTYLDLFKYLDESLSMEIITDRIPGGTPEAIYTFSRREYAVGQPAANERGSRSRVLLDDREYIDGLGNLHTFHAPYVPIVKTFPPEDVTHSEGVAMGPHSHTIEGPFSHTQQLDTVDALGYSVRQDMWAKQVDKAMQQVLEHSEIPKDWRGWVKPKAKKKKNIIWEQLSYIGTDTIRRTKMSTVIRGFFIWAINGFKIKKSKGRT